jgi:hypothetical protein
LRDIDGARERKIPVGATNAEPTHGPAAKLIPSQSAPPGPLLVAALREVRRESINASMSRQAAPPPQQKGWIGRHPVLFGALVGAGVGAVLSTSIEGCWESDICPIELALGAGAGAGAGALVGWVLSR